MGVLETRKHPTEEVIAHLVAKLPQIAESLTLLVAPASSLAGTAQVVARSVETALHKLHELKFDVNQVISGYGVAPLPQAWTLVSQAPAAAAGLADRGRIATGCRADLILVDANGERPQVVATIAGGRVVHLTDAARLLAA